MNLNMIRPKNETEDLLPSKTKNCETLIEQTHTKPQETLELQRISTTIQQTICRRNFNSKSC